MADEREPFGSERYVQLYASIKNITPREVKAQPSWRFSQNESVELKTFLVSQLLVLPSQAHEALHDFLKFLRRRLELSELERIKQNWKCYCHASHQEPFWMIPYPNLIYLFEMFCSDTDHLSYHPPELDTFRNDMRATMPDCTRPDLWYPLARQMQRRVFYHHGPTNSGKTYEALLVFRNAGSGIYCAPLRLLALEVFERTNELCGENFCNLATGDDMRIDESLEHLSCTVELADLSREWDVAIIDEIQMIGNDFIRGGAWTRAFLGLQAAEIHVCGDSTAKGVIEQLCSLTGDTFHLLEEKKRLVDLELEQDAVRDWENIRPGDCVVLFNINKYLEHVKHHIKEDACQVANCYAIYGPLPPEARKQQQDYFNHNWHKSALVASDAIGMGLNLSIHRIIFYELEKFDGSARRQLYPTEVKQIAGRAGRYGICEVGRFTSFHEDDYSRLKELCNSELDPLTCVGLSLELEPMTKVATLLQPTFRFDWILYVLEKGVVCDKLFFPCSMEKLRIIYNNITKNRSILLTYIFDALPFENQWKLCSAPIREAIPDYAKFIQKGIERLADRMIEEEEGIRNVFIGENNGTIPPEVRDLIKNKLEAMYPLYFFPTDLAIENIAYPLHKCEMLYAYLWLTNATARSGNILFQGSDEVECLVQETWKDVSVKLEEDSIRIPNWSRKPRQE